MQEMYRNNNGNSSSYNSNKNNIKSIIRDNIGDSDWCGNKINAAVLESCGINLTLILLYRWLRKEEMHLIFFQL
jgi:hypothetical protein